MEQVEFVLDLLYSLLYSKSTTDPQQRMEQVEFEQYAVAPLAPDAADDATDRRTSLTEAVATAERRHSLSGQLNNQSTSRTPADC